LRVNSQLLAELAARVVREVGALVRVAERATFTAAVSGLVARYHDAATPGGRAYRLIVVAHPLPRTATQQEDA
jgi:hypothetical protein